MRVAQLIHGGQFGGAEKAVWQLTCGFDHNDVEMHCICMSKGRLWEMLQQNKARHLALLPMRGKFDFSVLPRLVRYLKTHKIEIIQTHTCRTNFLGRLAARLCHIKNLTTVQTPVLKDTNEGLQLRRLNAWVERRFSSWAHLFVCVSEQDRLHLLRQGIPARKIRVIYNGAEIREPWLTPEQKRQKREELGIAADQKVVAMIAALRPRKGAEYFLQAIPLILPQTKQVKFLMVGDAEFVRHQDYLGSLKALSRLLQIESHVVFTGFRHDVDELLQITDILVLPSLFGEGLPLVLLEGMAFEVPLVTTQTEGNSEAVDDGFNGFLVPPYCPGKLAEKIALLLQDEQLRQAMGRRGRELALQKFSLPRILSHYREVYDELLTW